MRLRLTVCLVLWLAVGAAVGADVTIKGRNVTVSEIPVNSDKILGFLGHLQSAVALGAEDALKDREDLQARHEAFWAGLFALIPRDQRSEEDFTAYIKDGRFRMDSPSGTLIIRPDADPMFLMLDHRARQVIVVRRADIRAVDRVLPNVKGRGTLPATGETRTILGMTAQRHILEFEYGSEADPADYYILIRGDAWLAKDVAGGTEVRRFYDSMAEVIAGLSGGRSFHATAAAAMAAIARLGLPLQTRQEFKIFSGTFSVTALPGWDDLGVEAHWTSTSTVTSISFDPIDVDFFDAGPPAGYKEFTMPPAMTGAAPAACDCSCAGFKAFQALSERRGDPKAEAEMVAMLPCVKQCLSKWTACRDGC